MNLCNMHTTLEKGTVNVPAFLTKLWKIVEDKTYDRLICWSTTGKSFIIRNQSLFAKELLPLFFKHNNMASFIRQLNMCMCNGFRKLTSIENSGLRTMDKDEVEFFHQYFIKGQEKLLEMIKRKVTTTVCGNDDPKRKPEDVNGILTEVRDIKGRQESVDFMLSNMQRENEALWREIAMLRQKYQKQQQIIEKLIQFLLTLVHNRGIVKRKTPLMIDGASSGGPVIHDVTDTFTDVDIAENLPNFVNAASPAVVQDDNRSARDGMENTVNTSEILEHLDILDPLQSVVSETLIDDPGLDLQSIASDTLNDGPGTEIKNMKGSLNTPSPLNTPPGSPKEQEKAMTVQKTEGLDLVPSNHQTLESFNDHLEGIETELGWLQEQLSSGNFNIDSNSLLSLFDLDDPDEQISLNSNYNRYGRSGNEIVGNELIQYTPLSSLTPELDLSNITEIEPNKQQLTNEENDPQSQSISVSHTNENTVKSNAGQRDSDRSINVSKKRKIEK
ncbi:heat shock factor protein 1-like isoform X1 [Leptotrombidium deliense]|uniref:Heat shock factor protein 1-like isoform X1 n=1 Tax=Leptotrombidium deliense TaxID=299467 RepID=A0A443SEQ9_9ACAR|nr:heat shock factor protein 1-like isoform X1 [Leptotrombidium deliense]